MWSNWKLSTENPFLNFGEANGIEGVIDLDKAKWVKTRYLKSQGSLKIKESRKFR